MHWQDYLNAAARQVEIGAYHCEQLKARLKKFKGGAVPTPIQAHFEGAVLASLAAIDKVAQAVNSALKLRAQNGEKFEKAFKEICALEGVEEWYQNPLGIDLRRTRVRIAHYAYRKESRDIHLQVEDVSSKYDGSREISAYAESALEYAKELCKLIPTIEENLRSRLQ
jgi:hypothetical protein